MFRFGRALIQGVWLTALVMTPLFMFEGTAAAQVSAGSVAASLSSAELPPPAVELRADATRQRARPDGCPHWRPRGSCNRRDSRALFF
jgi:hypothetical protein